MKKLIFGLIAFMLFFATVKAQVINDESFEGSVMLLDSTNLSQDMKLLIANDRLFSPGGLIPVLINEASREKAETGKIEKANATQGFIENLTKTYNTYAAKFIKVDTVYVDSLKIENLITQITEWQQTVLSDPEIKNVTSLTIWEQKAKRLEKLTYYRQQLYNYSAK
jgi:hypothetical protein